jgi:tRNA uridine 5-carboxymethylaminomethyl modification enzyme
MGLVDDARWDHFNRKRDSVASEVERLKSVWVNPKTLDAQVAQALLGKQVEREYSLADLLKRPEVGYHALMATPTVAGDTFAGPVVLDEVAAEQVEIQVKYAGYVTRQQAEVEKQATHEQQAIPSNMDYDAVTSLSIEVRQRLKASRPQTVGQASRVSGITPAAMSLLLVHIKRLQYGKKAA